MTGDEAGTDSFGGAGVDVERVDRLAEVLVEARTRHRPLGPLAPDLLPRSTAEAEAVDDRVAAIGGWPVLGWKIGCTSVHAQELLGADGPFAGRVYSRFDSGVSLGSDVLLTEPNLEGEFAFTFGSDVEPVGHGARTGEGSERDRILAAIESIHPAIEIVGGRFARFLGTPLLALIADAGANSHLVVGPPAPSWDPAALATTTATMEVDGAVTGRGTGADVLGSPVEAVCWLAGHLSVRGITLAAGQVVTTGTATQVSALPVGSTATVTLAGIGSASLSRH